MVMMVVDGSCDDHYMNGDGNGDSMLMMMIMPILVIMICRYW